MTAMILPTTPIQPQQSETTAALLVDAVQTELSNSSRRELRNIGCELAGNVLILHGVVSSYYLKQLAQETVRQIDGVQRIVNLVSVSPAADPSERNFARCVVADSDRKVGAAG